MSRASLQAFLIDLEKDLSRNSNAYRRHTADRRTNHFVFLPRLFVEEIRKEFEVRDILNLFGKEAVQEHLNAGADKILEACRAEAKLFKKTRDVRIVSNQHFIKVTLLETANPKAKPEQNPNFDNFSKLKKLYTAEMNSFVLGLNEFMKEEYGRRLNKTVRDGYFDKEQRRFVTTGIKEGKTEVDKGADLAEGGHLEGAGILESRIADAIDKAINQNYTARANKEILLSNLEALGIDLTLIRDDSTESFIFTAESRAGNQEAGFESAKAKDDFMKQLRAAIERLNDKTPIAGLKGSDSPTERFEKKAVKVVLKQFKGKKRVTTSKDPKLETSRRSSTSKKKGKVKTNSALNLGKTRVPKPKLPATKAQKSPYSIASYIGIFNQQLPGVIAKNMVPPALQYQTGRFASSVRVTDITQTAKGFPSVGYTYQRNPYETFEQGNRQGSIDRDPRRLIDKSLREIAVQFAVGRFYTRRV